MGLVSSRSVSNKTITNSASDIAAEFPEVDPERPLSPLAVFDGQAVVADHPSEPDLFARHADVPAHDQTHVAEARYGLIGGGGLNSAAGLALVRSGARFMTVIDEDRVDRTNLSRQLFFKDDLFCPKGISLAKNLSMHAIAGGSVTGIAMSFQDAIKNYQIPADIFIVGVDNNACRLAAVREARIRGIPAIFTMLSSDSARCHAFSQGPSPLDPCLWCALPDLDPEESMPCVAAIITSCFMAASYTVFFAHRALCGWAGIRPFNWREADLYGISPERTGVIEKRRDCRACSDLC